MNIWLNLVFGVGVSTLSVVGMSHAAQAVDSDGGRCFNVHDFGAVADGKTLDSPAINRAIEACAAAGGGRVVVPKGTYLCGSIRLTSCLDLHLADGAVLVGAPQEMNAYDETEPFAGAPYQDAGHSFFHNSLMWGVALTNVSVTGSGRINGGGLTDRPDPVMERVISNLRAKKADALPMASSRIGNKIVALKNCQHVVIRGVTFYHGGHFAILLTGCDTVTVDGVTIDTNRDGIDLDCCANTVVSNSRVNSDDDAICLKSTMALDEKRFCENITVTNCQVSGFEEGTLLDGTMKKTTRTGTGRIKLGTESSGGFRNCTITDCTFLSCRGLTLVCVDGGVLENVTVSNLRMRDLLQFCIFVATGERNRSPEVKAPSLIRNVVISNIVAEQVSDRAGILVMGLPARPLENVRIENVHFTSVGGGQKKDTARVPVEVGRRYPEPNRLGTMPSYGIFARHAKNLEFANVELRFEAKDERPAMAFSDLDGLMLDRLQAQVTEGAEPVIFAPDVKNVRVSNSPSIKIPSR